VERDATLTTVEPGERLEFSWDDEGEVAFALADDPAGTRLTVTETLPAESPHAFAPQASALAVA
jgi:hypothetical protein